MFCVSPERSCVLHFFLKMAVTFLRNLFTLCCCDPALDTSFILGIIAESLSCRKFENQFASAVNLKVQAHWSLSTLSLHLMLGTVSLSFLHFVKIMHLLHFAIKMWFVIVEFASVARTNIQKYIKSAEKLQCFGHLPFSADRKCSEFREFSPTILTFLMDDVSFENFRMWIMVHFSLYCAMIIHRKGDFLLP